MSLSVCQFASLSVCKFMVHRNACAAKQRFRVDFESRITKTKKLNINILSTPTKRGRDVENEHFCTLVCRSIKLKNENIFSQNISV